ncbi:hypothetical protein U1Q18_040001 [Sarracenia purpurea var. burkii]
MSCISQNVHPKDQIEKIKRKASKKPLLLKDDGELEERKEDKPDTYNTKKRKEEHVEEDKQLEIEQENEMKKLEKFLFGSLYSPVEFGKQDDEESRDEIIKKSSVLFFTDRSANGVLSIYENDAEFQENTDDEEGVRQRKPVWVDEQEEKISINIATVNKLRKLRKEENESSRTYSFDDEDSDVENGPAGPSLGLGYKDIEGIDDILRTNEDLVVKGNAKLLPGLLEYSRLVNANAEDPSSGPINSVQFHRNTQLLLTGGLDRKLTFFQIDGKRNTKIQSIFLEDCPVRKASFVPDGSQVLAAGRRRFFYSFDLVKAEVDKIGPLIGREERSLEVFEVSHDSKTIAFVGNEGSNLLQKMSWISQNVRPKDQIKKIKMNASNKPLLLKDDGELEERKEDKPDTYRTKKRKEEHVEEDKQLEIEQEKEMKKLEKFLFGSLYSPVEFGKQDDEESSDEIIEKSSVLFLTDRSANSVLSIYENDAELPENTDDEEGARQRKPVWVDEQEEKISINIARVN